MLFEKRKGCSLSRRFSYALIGVVTLLLIAFATIGLLFNISVMEGELEDPDEQQSLEDLYDALRWNSRRRTSSQDAIDGLTRFWEE